MSPRAQLVIFTLLVLNETQTVASLISCCFTNKLLSNDQLTEFTRRSCRWMSLCVMAVRVLEDNSALRQKLSTKAEPVKEFFQVETIDGERTFTVALFDNMYEINTLYLNLSLNLKRTSHVIKHQVM